MLVLSRKPGQAVEIEGGITVTLVEVEGGRVRLGFDAPASVRILRSELASFLDGERENPLAAAMPPRKG